MATEAGTAAMVVYCDSVILIYFLDHTGPFKTRATTRLGALRAASDLIAVSDLTRLECRVKPIQVGNAAALALFDGFFAQPDVRLVPLTTTVYDRATLIRATHGFKVIDSLHLAAAVEAGCDRFSPMTPGWRFSLIFQWKCCRERHQLDRGRVARQGDRGRAALRRS